MGCGLFGWRGNLIVRGGGKDGLEGRLLSLVCVGIRGGEGRDRGGRVSEDSVMGGFGGAWIRWIV